MAAGTLTTETGKKPSKRRATAASRFFAVPANERNAAVLAVGISISLTALKFWAYVVTGSAAVFSDALESIVNIAASGFAFYALIVSHAPPDEEHPYGHGKIEFLSAAFEGGLIFAAAGGILYQAIAQWFRGPVVSHVGWGALLIAITAIVNGLVGMLLLRIGRKRSSLALEADGKHLLSDVVTTGGVLVSLGLVALTGKLWIDVAAAVLVSLYLFKTSADLIRQSTAGLMDEQDAKDDTLLKAILDRHVRGESLPRICSYHKLRHRHTGRYHWIDFHVIVPQNMTVLSAHAMASQIEAEMEKALGEGDATAHIEPCGESSCGACGGPVAVAED